MIQFQCDDCDAYLRASDDKAGRRVLCPHCGAKIVVPDVDFSLDDPLPPTEDPSADPLGEQGNSGASGAGQGGAGQGGDEWFTELGDTGDLSQVEEPKIDPPPPSPLDEDQAVNEAKEPKPGESGDEPLPTRRQLHLPDLGDPVRRRTLWPAMGVLAVSVLSLWITLLYTPLLAWQVYQVLNGAQGVDGCAVGAVMFFTIVSGVYYVIALSRGIHLLLMTDYEQALVATVMAMIPCSPCCLLGLPLGLWALQVLRDEEVKQAFLK